jgi:hypothetical protein
MTPKQFQRFLDRDKYCLHCGTDTTLIPNHRANRGMGGSKKRDVPSNIVVLCAEFNGRIESNERAASVAREMGWKLWSWENPKNVPVYDSVTNEWFYLDDLFGRTVVVDFIDVLIERNKK